MVGSGLTDATRGGRSRCVIRILTAMPLPE